MKTPLSKFHATSRLALCLALPALSGCQPEQPHTLLTQPSVKKYLQATVLQGNVIDQQGVSTSGRVQATDALGRMLAQTDVNAHGRYRLEIPADTVLPVVLSYTPAATAGDQPTLTTVAIDPAIRQYDLNTLTTAIANKAKALGGYTRANMIVAAESMIAAPEANKTSTGFRGDPTQQYGGWH